MNKPALTDQDMPPLEELDEESNYQQFFSEGVSDSLRTQALRKLFRLAKYNVVDGLDDYTEDYHRFEVLGDVVTADLRYQLQRKRDEAIEKELTQDEIAEKIAETETESTRASEESSEHA